MVYRAVTTAASRDSTSIAMAPHVHVGCCMYRPVVLQKVVSARCSESLDSVNPPEAADTTWPVSAYSFMKRGTGSDPSKT